VNLDAFIASTKITSLNMVESVIWRIGHSSYSFRCPVKDLHNKV
jgi:hypothetical protein